jgi:hypothetical protein
VDEVLGKEEIGLAREGVKNLGAEKDQIGQQINCVCIREKE